MSDLKERLDDLLVAVPSYVVPDGLARDARTAGARRRLRHRLVVGGAVAALVAIGGAVVGAWPSSLHLAPAGSTRHAEGYPTRIDYPWWGRTLSDRPGPIEGLVERDASSADASNWWAVTEDGGLLRLPQRDFDREPVLSPTGTKLAVFSGPAGAPEQGRMELWDLATGRTVTLDQVGSNVDDLPDRPEYWLQEQVPGFWSPDEQRVVLNVQRWTGGRIDGAVASWDGAVVPIRLDTGDSVWPVGWVDDERIGWLVEDGQGKSHSARFIVSDTVGAVEASYRLDLAPDTLARGALSQWSGWLSPDGSRLAMRYETKGMGEPSIGIFDVATGRELDRWRVYTTDTYGSLVWQGDRIVAPYVGDSEDAILVDTAGSTELIRADPRSGITYSYWAADALAGGPRRSTVGLLTGNSDWRIVWWWRETLLAVAVLGLLWWTLRALRRRLGR